MLGAIFKALAGGLTKRQLSRKVDNTRKKLRRRKNKIEKTLESADPVTKSQLYRELESIDTTLEESRYNRQTRGYSDTVLGDLERAINRAERSLDPATLSSRESFRWDMQNAGLSQIDEQSARIFMRLTQDAWQGVENENRIDAILDAFGSNDIYAVYNEVMSSEQAQRALKALENTDDMEQDERYQQWILKVIPLNL